MKRNLIILFMLLVVVALLVPFGCQKEEDVVPIKEPTYKLEFVEAEDILSLPVEYRSGGPQFVEFEGSNTVAHIFVNIFPQYGFQPAFTDSIVYHRAVPEITAEIPDDTGMRQFKCLYDATYYLAPPLVPVYFDKIYRKFSYDAKIVRIPTGPSWGNNIAFFEFMPGNGYVTKFDPACQKDRRQYEYRQNQWYSNNTMSTVTDTLAGNRECLNIYRLRQRW